MIVRIMSEDLEPNAKVRFIVPDEDGEVDIETLWAFNLGDDMYKIDNLPYFAYGVSWNDVVLAPFDEDGHFPTYKHVVSKSGNRTIRIFFDVKFTESSESSALLDKLVADGCDFENCNGRLVVLSIPKTVELNRIADQLNDADVPWEYADPTYEELFPDG